MKYHHEKVTTHRDSSNIKKLNATKLNILITYK